MLRADAEVHVSIEAARSAKRMKKSLVLGPDVNKAGASLELNMEAASYAATMLRGFKHCFQIGCSFDLSELSGDNTLFQALRAGSLSVDHKWAVPMVARHHQSH